MYSNKTKNINYNRTQLILTKEALLHQRDNLLHRLAEIEQLIKNHIDCKIVPAENVNNAIDYVNEYAKMYIYTHGKNYINCLRLEINNGNHDYQTLQKLQKS